MYQNAEDQVVSYLKKGDYKNALLYLQSTTYDRNLIQENTWKIIVSYKDYIIAELINQALDTRDLERLRNAKTSGIGCIKELIYDDGNSWGVKRAWNWMWRYKGSTNAEVNINIAKDKIKALKKEHSEFILDSDDDKPSTPLGHPGDEFTKYKSM